MNVETLAALEQGIEPYLRAGYVVAFQTESSITMVGPPRKFSYLGFIVGLILFWPAAVLYLVFYNNRRDRSVCLRVTSQGLIEASGYTLEAAGLERWRAFIPVVVGVLIMATLVGLLLLRFSVRFWGLYTWR